MHLVNMPIKLVCLYIPKIMAECKFCICLLLSITYDIQYIPIFDISIQFKLCRYCITGLMYHDMAIYRYIVASLTCTHTNAHIHTHTHTCMLTHTCTHTYIHTNMHTYTHTLTHAHMLRKSTHLWFKHNILLNVVYIL